MTPPLPFNPDELSDDDHRTYLFLRDLFRFLNRAATGSPRHALEHLASASYWLVEMTDAPV